MPEDCFAALGAHKPSHSPPDASRAGIVRLNSFDSFGRRLSPFPFSTVSDADLAWASITLLDSLLSRSEQEIERFYRAGVTIVEWARQGWDFHRPEAADEVVRTLDIPVAQLAGSRVPLTTLAKMRWEPAAAMGVLLMLACGGLVVEVAGPGDSAQLGQSTGTLLGISLFLWSFTFVWRSSRIVAPQLWPVVVLLHLPCSFRSCGDFILPLILWIELLRHIAAFTRARAQWLRQQ